MPADRRPWFAALLTIPAPGLGHLYAGRPKEALLWAAGVMACVTPLGLMAIALPLGVLSVMVIWSLPVLQVVLPGVFAWRAAAQASRPFPGTRFNRWYWYAGFLVVSATVGTFVLNTFVRSRYQGLRSTSEAMAPTILSGDALFMAKGASQLASVVPPDIVVFESPETSGLLIVKRLVGAPGDTLAMVQGTLIRNRHAVSESYARHEDSTAAGAPELRARIRAWQTSRVLLEDTTSYQPDQNNWGPLVVPPDSFFVLGDNRDYSYDSRHYGWVGRDRLRGVPWVIYYSYDPDSWRVLPIITAVRWDRPGRRFAR